MMQRYLMLLVLCLSTSNAEKVFGDEPARRIRAGMIGLDTSHVIHFTRDMNNPQAKDARADVQIVAGFPAGSGASRSRRCTC